MAIQKFARQVMEIAMRISESKAMREKLESSVRIEPEVRPVFDPVCWRTSGSGH
jgi:hypothetical protein